MLFFRSALGYLQCNFGQIIEESSNLMILEEKNYITNVNQWPNNTQFIRRLIGNDVTRYR